MELQTKSQELKNIVAIYDTQWLLGNLSFLMTCISNGFANDQLRGLSSPMRQLYFLGGLLMSSNPTGVVKNQYTNEEWNDIVDLLNEIELEYFKLFFPKEQEEITEHWKQSRMVAMSSFLSYFNLGPLNYEEQTIRWVQELYEQLDEIIEGETTLRTKDFLQFYENIDKLHLKNYESHVLRNTPLRENWDKYSQIEISMVENIPEELKNIGEEMQSLTVYLFDPGIINRFHAEELVSASLPLENVKIILAYLSTERIKSDFLYYTSTKPGNCLYERPIVQIGDGMYQVFEMKQVIHAINNLFETICSRTMESTTMLVEKKGKLLENRIIELFELFLKHDYEKYVGYYVDGCEQDILFLWKDYAFIIEAKGYNIREPFRDPERAFIRIRDDFNSCIGYAYEQTKRIEQKFINKENLRITDRNGNLITEIDTTKYENNHFSIIVNIESFGVIQTDLSYLLNVDAKFPWAVTFDDLEVFILTLIAQKRSPTFFVDYLLFREELHGRLICADEMEVCGGFISNIINEKNTKSNRLIVTLPDLADVFDQQYRKGIGFNNEKYFKEKQSGEILSL